VLQVAEEAEEEGEGEGGVVESITLKNFMCHALLGPFAFGTNVNFIVGNNGSEFERSVLMCCVVLCRRLFCFAVSRMLQPDRFNVVFSSCAPGGKSAVLTALIVALGGTAQATNRGASLKGFVKEGERYREPAAPP